MIPYDDLVSALQGWRGKQGLPVSGAVTSGSGPARTAPPVAPPPQRAPSVVESLDDAEYIEDAPVEEAYEAAADGEAEAEPVADEVAYAAADDGTSEIEPTAIGAIPGAPEFDEEQPAPRAADDQADW